MTEIRDSSGRRLRSTKEWLETAKREGHSVIAIKIYNNKEKKIVEGFRNLTTQKKLLSKIRRPSLEEELKYDTILFQKGKSPVTGKPYNQLEIRIDDNGTENVSVKTKESIERRKNIKE